jgi:microcystin-dependent protein
VSSYDITTGAYNVNVTSSNGSGTYSGWQISVSGVPGPTGAAGGSGTPIGGFLLWRTASLPTDFLWASGPAYTPCLSNITYATLYAVVGDADTAANGCIQGTTFGITDMRNVFPMGAGSGYALGTTGGSATHTQVPAEVAYSDVTITSSANQGLAQGTGVSLLNGNGGVWINGGMASIAGYTGYVSPQPMNIMNPYRAMNWIVKYQ